MGGNKKTHSFLGQNFHFTLKWPWSQSGVSGGCLDLNSANYLWCNYLWEWSVCCTACRAHMLSSRPSVALRARPELDLWASRGWGVCFWSPWMCNIKYTWKEPAAPSALHEQGVGWEEGGMRRGGVTSVSFQVGFYGTTSNNRSSSLFLSLSPPWSLYRANWTVIGLSSLSWACLSLYTPLSLFSEVTCNKCVNSPGARKTELLYSFREIRCGEVSQLTSVKHLQKYHI